MNYLVVIISIFTLFSAYKRFRNFKQNWLLLGAWLMLGVYYFTEYINKKHYININDDFYKIIMCLIFLITYYKSKSSKSNISS